MRERSSGASLILLALAAASAHGAGGHYRVDDAGIVGFEQCQLETWYARAGGDDWETVVAPACQFVRDLEVTLEWITARERGERGSSLVLEGKRLLAAQDDGRLLGSIVGGFEYETRDDQFTSVHLYLPGTMEATDALILHGNLGWRWDDDQGHLMIWGAAAEWRAWAQLHLIGEVFGNGRGRTGQQIGLRPILIDDRLHLDFAVARDRLTGPSGSTWWTVALNLTF